MCCHSGLNGPNSGLDGSNSVSNVRNSTASALRSFAQKHSAPLVHANSLVRHRWFVIVAKRVI